jgi:hypothetical protein
MPGRTITAAKCQATATIITQFHKGIMENEKVKLTAEQVAHVRALEAEITRDQHFIEALNVAKGIYITQILKAAGITDGQFKIDLETGTIAPKGD